MSALDPPCEHGNYPHPDDHHCWHHCVEVVPPDVFIVCFECQHAWTQEALEQAWLDEAPRGSGVLPRKAESIPFCPLCLHDF